MHVGVHIALRVEPGLRAELTGLRALPVFDSGSCGGSGVRGHGSAGGEEAGGGGAGGAVPCPTPFCTTAPSTKGQTGMVRLLSSADSAAGGSGPVGRASDASAVSSRRDLPGPGGHGGGPPGWR